MFALLIASTLMLTLQKDLICTCMVLDNNFELHYSARATKIGNFLKSTEELSVARACQLTTKVLRSFLPWPSSPCTNIGIAILLASSLKSVLQGCLLRFTCNTCQYLHLCHRQVTQVAFYCMPNSGPQSSDWELSQNVDQSLS